MEVDWSVEIGADLPCIVVPWSGDGFSYVDLAHSKEPAALIAGIVADLNGPGDRSFVSPLAQALLALNADSSPVFTSKCDVWQLRREDIDPLEFDAPGKPRIGRACYLDLLFRSAEIFASFETHEEWMRRSTMLLREIPLPSARIELVLRQAEILEANEPPSEGFAITLYVLGCGQDSGSANEAWSLALDEAVRLASESEPPRLKR